MKTLSRVLLILSMTAFGATSIEAAAADTGDAPPEVRVVNNYVEMVRVYAEDSKGRLHKLGRVARGDLVEFEIPDHIAAEAFRIKVFPGQPAWSLQVDDFAIKTNPLHLRGDADVTLWLEADLARSVVEMNRG